MGNSPPVVGIDLVLRISDEGFRISGLGYIPVGSGKYASAHIRHILTRLSPLCFGLQGSGLPCPQLPHKKSQYMLSCPIVIYTHAYTCKHMCMYMYMMCKLKHTYVCQGNMRDWWGGSRSGKGTPQTRINLTLNPKP